MGSRVFVSILLCLALAAMACTVTIPIPPSDSKVGPTETKEILVESTGGPEETVSLTLGLGAGELLLRPGEGDAVVSGTATYNISDFEPVIDAQGTQVTIEQGDLQLDGIPDFRGEDVINRWDLELGKQPLELRINAGAYEGDLELGGLSLRQLSISDGAASVRIHFSEPNPIRMDALRYATGASDVRLDGLGNANFASLQFDAGAGNYVLDFSGNLRQQASVKIESGLSRLRILVPHGVAARADVVGELSEVKAEGEWTLSGTSYVHPGEGPGLTFVIHSSVGSVQLESGR